MVQNRNKVDLSSEIVLLLLDGEMHLRGIARELSQPHSTILRRLTRLREENVIDYVAEGKNKVFSIKKGLQARNYALMAERYKFIKLLRTYPELNVIIGEILKNVKEPLIALFGSYAKFSAKNDSDIDIYIETTKRKAKEDAEAVNSKLKAKVGTFDLDSNLIKEIIKNHIILRGEEEFYEKTKFFEKT